MGPLLLSNLGSIVTALSALAAILATISTIAKNRAPKPTIFLDPSLKVLTIKRFSVEKALLADFGILWGDLKKMQLSNQIALSTIVVVIYTLLYFSIDLFVLDTHIIFYFFGLFSVLLFFCTFLYFQYKKYRLFGKNPEEGKFIVFHHAEMVVQSDYHHLVLQCHQALKKLGVQSVEIENRADLSSCCVAAPTATIHISASEGVPEAYKVVLEPLPRTSKEESVKLSTSPLHAIQLRIIQTTFITSLVDQSKYINLLIDQIVSKQDFDKREPEAKLATR